VFADNNLGAKIDFSVFLKKDIIKYLFAENIGIVFQAKDDDALESKLNANNFYKMGTVTTEATLDLGPSKLLLSTETFGLKLRFIRSKQSKTEWRKRVLTIIKTKHKLYFSNTFHRKKPVIDASKPRPKAAIIRERK
jgi:phosphoribosylformylglycinamidine synthase